MDTAPGRALLVHFGPTLHVDIGFDPDFAPGKNIIPVASITDVLALIDTGATESHIDEQAASAMDLPIVDQRSYGGSTGLHPANMYLAQIRVPALNYTVWGEFAGVNLAAGGLTHRALIGRTFLQNFNLQYWGPIGAVTLSMP